jgi:N utilization substance protein B
VYQITLILAVKKFTAKRLKVAKGNRVSKLTNEQGFNNIIHNSVFTIFEESETLKEFIKHRNIDVWDDATEYVQIVFNEMIEKEWFLAYNKIKNTTFNQDLDFIKKMFVDVIAPNEKIIDYYESIHLGWLDDIAIVNTELLKELKQFKPTSVFVLDDVFKDQDDYNFVIELFTKSVLKHTEFDDEIDELTPNWEYDRIATIDLILIKMALTEFLYFPSIPTKVSINEYIEIAKDYSSDKSSYFINGVLDKLLKKYLDNKKINKIGRGLR